PGWRAWPGPGRGRSVRARPMRASPHMRPRRAPPPDVRARPAASWRSLVGQPEPQETVEELAARGAAARHAAGRHIDVVEARAGQQSGESALDEHVLVQQRAPQEAGPEVDADALPDPRLEQK